MHRFPRRLAPADRMKSAAVRLLTVGIAVLVVAVTRPSAVAAPGPDPSEHPTPIEDFERGLEAFIGPLLGDGFLSGNLSVTHRGEVIYRASYGMADVEHGVANGPETRFCVASLSKPMTALAALRLVEDERLSLDDPVSRWIDDFPSGDEMTVEDVLTHRAGIPHRVTVPLEESRPMTAADIVAKVREKGLLHEPRTSRTYSSAGYSVVAHILEKVMGSDYDTAMRELLFSPLGMSETAHADSRSIVPHRASPYRAGPDGLINATLKDMSFLVGGGSLLSTVGDVQRFVQAYLDRALLSETGWEIFHDRLGWARGEVVRWSGASNGFGAFADIHKELGLTVVFTGNAGLGALQELRRGVPAIVFGQEHDPPKRIPPVSPLSETTLKEYEGTYARGDGVTLKVVLSDGDLYSNDGVIHPTAKDWFFSRGYYTVVEFGRGDDGRVQEMRLHIDGLGIRVHRRTDG